MGAPLTPQPPQPQNNALIWVLVGCAGLLVLGLCTATGIGVWMVMEEAKHEFPLPAPAPAPAPVPPGQGPAIPNGPGPALPPPPTMDLSPRMVTAVVTSVTGAAPVQNGATCGFAVERHPYNQPPGFWCRAQISCGGRLLYGGTSSGYFPCTLHEQPRRDVVGSDDDTTAVDTDASMRLDTQRETLVIRDDASGPYGAFSVEARITDVR